MRTNHKILRWGLRAIYLWIITSMLACAALGLGTSTVDAGALQIKDNAVEVKSQNGQWMPVAGASTFELVGTLKSMNPWVVAGTTLETTETTRIEDGLKVGDLVRVKGTLLEGGKWVAYSIERAEQQTNPSPTIVFIGKVTSKDPWVVNGITLKVTADTVITGDIAVGMFVRVEVLLLENGTWEVISIAPLGDFAEVNGCVTVAATIVSVTADKIQFVGWPSMPLSSGVKIESNGGKEGEQNNEQANVVLNPNQNVLVVLCPSKDNQIIITKIIVLVINAPDENGNESSGNGEKVLVCHKPKKNAHTLSLPPSAVPAHLAHGDTLGPCP